MGGTWIPILWIALAGLGQSDAKPKTNPDEAFLEKVGVKLDEQALLEFFRARTLSPAARAHYESLVDKLSSNIFEERRQASDTLTGGGAVALDILRSRLKNGKDLETNRRIELCIANISRADFRAGTASAAVRVLAQRKPAEAVTTLLAYVPFAEKDGAIDALRSAFLDLVDVEGKPHPKIVDALADPAAPIRAIAGETLWTVFPKNRVAALEKLLDDPDPSVRCRVALAALRQKEHKAGPILIATLSTLPLDQAWLVEDLLLRVSAERDPPSVALGAEPRTRKACQDAWLAWWKTHGTKVDFAKLVDETKSRGFTTVVLLDLGTVLDLAPDNTVRWKVDGLMFPLDVQVLDDHRILVAEYHARRVTERKTSDGSVIWTKVIEDGPLIAQRLPSGNTFVATDQNLLEFDKSGAEVLRLDLSQDENRKVMKAMKLANGEIACLRYDGKIQRLDAKGKELGSFDVSLGTRLFGGRIQMLPSGRVLVPHHAEDKVVEYDSKGKVVWEVEVEKPVAAVRLGNGNTLVTSMLPAIGAVEFDRFGNEVWSYRHQVTRVTRALRR